MANYNRDTEMLQQYGGLEQNSLTSLLTSNDPDEDDLNMPEINHSSYYDIDEFNQLNESTLLEDFLIMSLNCQSLRAKHSAIELFLDSLNKKPHVLILQETWLGHADSISHLKIPNYKIISQCKRISAHGGLAIYLHDSIPHSPLDINCVSDIFECQFIELCIPVAGQTTKSVVIGNIYRLPININDNYEQFTNEFVGILNNFAENNKNVIIAGDYNINLLQINDRPIIREYLDSVMSCGFLASISLPSRFGFSGCSLIDNFIMKVTPESLSQTPGLITSAISDHLIYFTSIGIKQSRKQIKYREIIRETPDSLANFKIGIQNSNLLAKFDHSPLADPNKNYEKLYDTLHVLHNLNYPRKNVKINHYREKKSKWITNEQLHQLKYRDKLYLKLKKTPRNSDAYFRIKHDLYLYNKFLKTSIRAAKKEHFNNYFDEVKGNSQKTWAKINEIIGKAKSKKEINSLFRTDDNIVITDEKSIASHFNNFFSQVSDDHAESDSVPHFTNFLNGASNKIFNFHPVTVDNVVKLTNDLKTKTSSGFDELSTALLKSIIHEIKEPITFIINQCIRTGIFPDLLKISKVIPLFKKNNEQLFDNYRPISLLPSISKIFEKVLHTQISEFFEDNNLFFGSQYGFRPSHSTQHAALELADRCMISVDSKKTPFAVFIDLSKAFDLVRHDVLLKKLSFYGFDQSAIKLCQSYLNNRKQYVRFGNSNSDEIFLEKGLPQGSILSPLMFSIFINDLPNVAPKFDKIIYADDTSLFSTLESFDPDGNSSIEVISNEINLELKKVIDWVKANKLKVNLTKTKFMCFRPKQKEIIYPSITIQNTIIEKVNNFNFLGIVFDQFLDWSCHIKHIVTKLSRITGVINRVKNVVPCRILKTLFDSLFMCHLHYGLLNWGYTIGANKVLKLQKKAIRIVLNAHRLAHTDILFKNMGILKVTDLIKVQELKMYFAFKNGKLPVYLQLMFHNYERTNYQTRIHYILEPFRPRLELSKAQLRHRLPLSVNDCPNIILRKCETHSIEGFSKYIKAALISKYNSECHINNCYSCQIIQGQ